MVGHAGPVLHKRPERARRECIGIPGSGRARVFELGERPDGRRVVPVCRLYLGGARRWRQHEHTRVPVGARPRRVLAATSFIIDTVTGALLESDVFSTARFSGPHRRPARPSVDVEHRAARLGHLSGLGHSMIGETELQANGGRRVIAAEAVMFRIACRQHGRQTPRAGDIAGMSDLYPDGNLSENFEACRVASPERQRRVWRTRCRLQFSQWGDDREFLVGHRGSFSIAGLSQALTWFVSNPSTSGLTVFRGQRTHGRGLPGDVARSTGRGSTGRRQRRD